VINASDVEGLLRPLTIDVKVSLTESGVITHSEVEEYGTPPNFTLANAALAAAQKWTFAPARVDGISVASEVVLHFYFSR
jgi:TonB family protein